MIPLKLTVKNFMCYRDDVPSLDFEGIHIACLCGDNGNGKSALLDAITWSLWGEARTRTQEELIHQGQQDMSVELEFLARDQRYRVIRRHSRSGRSRQGHTILEFHVASVNGYHAITGNTMRDTEAKIRDILHMDFDTFVNTAFLRQGDADRFTTSTPSKRKECLAEVLDLSYYGKLEERAKAKSRTMQETMRDIESAVAMRRQEIARKPDYEEELASVSADLARIEPEVETQAQKVEQLRREVDSLQAQRQELQLLAKRLSDAQGEITQLEAQAKNHDARVVEYESVLQKQSEIRERFTALGQAKTELDRLNQALARKSTLDGEKAKQERDVAVQRERLSNQAEQLRKRISDELTPKAQRLPEIEEAQRQAAIEEQKLSELTKTISEHRGEAEEIDGKARYLTQVNATLRNDMEDTRKKFDMLEQGKATCPLCNQPLGIDGKAHLRQEYESQGLERKQRYQQNDAEIKGLKARHETATAQVSRLEAELDGKRRSVQTRAATLTRDHEESQKAQAELKTAGAALEAAEGQLSREDFAHEARKKLVELEAGLSTLGYDAAAHKASRKQVKALESYDALHSKLTDAEERLPDERSALESSRQMLERRQNESRDSRECSAKLQGGLKRMPSIESELAEVNARYQQLDKRKNDALVRRGVLEKQIERCDALEAEVRQQESKHRTLINEKSIYDELTVAFGKNGIQALIIESAIPQLESDANEILGRLTQNLLSLRLQLIEGRRDRNTGVPSEELDIKIADEVGTRSYETFSGGEAFRINFALRIALSKLLARRSGAPLPILFIDEGFGSQDSAGQERLIEAIQSIQDDFDKIIVITHIEQIKDAFPVRVEVSKNGGSSTFTVV